MFKFIRPESFDIFGILTFGFITILSVWLLKTGQTIPEWALFILLGIGILGILVDGVIVYRTYIKKSL